MYLLVLMNSKQILFTLRDNSTNSHDVFLSEGFRKYAKIRDSSSKASCISSVF